MAETKQCSKCKEMKPLPEFYLHESTRKLHSKCKLCQVLESRQWRAKNPEKCRETAKRYNEKTKEKAAAYGAKYWKKNKKKLQKYHRKYHKKHAAEISARNKKKRAESPIPYDREQRRKSHLKITFGLSIDDYDKLVKNQNGACAVCGKKPKKRLHVDHCHATKAIRGLLCQKCNQALGLFQDDLRVLQKAIEYLAVKGQKNAG